MANDTEKIPLGNARTAIRLCNFPTGKSKMLDSHKQWLDQNVKQFLASCPYPWVDMFGYASHLGNPISNKKLSDDRCDEVMHWLQTYNPKTGFPQEFGYGDSRSTGGRTDDDGYWRAVEIYVYGSVPPGKVPRTPVVLPESPDWYVTNFSGDSLSVVVALGFTAIMGTITFQRPSGRKYEGPIGIFGPSIGLSYTPKLGGLISKIPGIDRFPLLKTFLAPGNVGITDELLKVMSSAPPAIAKAIWNYPRILNLVKTVAEGMSGGKQAWMSGAIGQVFPSSRVSTIEAVDFSGPCICYAVTGTAAVANFGTYVLFFGLDRNWSVLSDPLALLDLSRIDRHAKGVAVFAAASVQANIPALGAGATIFFGEIV
jgi:hypothetical protein